MSARFHNLLECPFSKKIERFHFRKLYSCGFRSLVKLTYNYFRLNISSFISLLAFFFSILRVLIRSNTEKKRLKFLSKEERAIYLLLVLFNQPFAQFLESLTWLTFKLLRKRSQKLSEGALTRTRGLVHETLLSAKRTISYVPPPLLLEIVRANNVVGHDSNWVHSD